jgi:hypothetical protein
VRLIKDRGVSYATVFHPPLKWSDLRYVFDIQEGCNGKEATISGEPLLS